jgi:hypothetical protein
MITADVEFYNVVLFFHITSVVLAFGPTFAYGLFIAIAQREGGVAVPAVGRSIVTWDRIAGTLGMVVILISGIYMASSDARGWEFSDFFISWGFVAILLLFGLVHGYFGPRTRKAVELAERDLGGSEGKLSTEFDALSAQIAKVGSAAGLVIVLTIYVMTAKPFL